jgi:hypothetical protein
MAIRRLSGGSFAGEQDFSKRPARRKKHSPCADQAGIDMGPSSQLTGGSCEMERRTTLEVPEHEFDDEDWDTEDDDLDPDEKEVELDDEDLELDEDEEEY